jgi:hypothetical protein
MKRYEQVLKSNITGYRGSVKRQDALKMMKEIAKQSAWEAWNFSCEAFYKLNGMPYTDKQIGIERQAFETFWNEELK